MTGCAQSSLQVLMPPEFEYLGGLFLPDFGRARLACRVASAVHRWRRSGYPVQFDAGCSGLTAGQEASRLAGQGITRAVVVGGEEDRTGAETLRLSLLQAGIDVPPPLISSGDGTGLLHRVRREVEGLPKDAGLLQHTGPAAQRPSPVLLITGGDDPPSSTGVVFQEADGGLRRLSAGRAGSIPSRISLIRVVDPRAAALDDRPNQPVAGHGTVLHGLALPALEHHPGNPGEDWLCGAGEFVGRAGSRHCRLIGPPRCTPAERGVAWAARYGLHHRPGREALLELVSACFPRWLALLQTVVGFHEMGVDPLEEMYAGNSLADRNAELIENIVP